MQTPALSLAQRGAATEPANTLAVAYLLRIGDAGLIHGQRLAEWCGHAPVLEEDIALANIALDHIGQARAVLTLAGEIEGRGRDEDALAYQRREPEFFNPSLLELPHAPAGSHDPCFGRTVLRIFLWSSFASLQWRGLARSNQPTLAGIAGKAVKECRYHLQHSADWVVRLGDGSAESHQRMQAALEALWPYTAELFDADGIDAHAAATGLGPSCSTLQGAWRNAVEPVLQAATLGLPAETPFRSLGKQGRHTEHIGATAGGNAVAGAQFPRGGLVIPAATGAASDQRLSAGRHPPDGRPQAAQALDAPDRPVGTAEAATTHTSGPLDIPAIWAVLENVLDPEVPVLSVVELGIVREVTIDGAGTVTVDVTPTYSGCPATEAIEEAIRSALTTAGAARVAVQRRHAPAWTTDWLSATARDKLRAYGIAPPAHLVEGDALESGDAGGGLASAAGAASAGPSATGHATTRPVRFHARGIACPQCGSLQVERLSAFGGTACKALYRCLACREPFDYFKPI